MPTTKRKQLIVAESDGEIPPPSPELIEVAESVCAAAAELAKLRERIRFGEQRYRKARTAAADAQERHDQSQGLGGLAARVGEVNATKLALERAEAEVCEAQRVLPNAEAKLAELDARHRTLAYELIAPLRASAASRYRCAAEDLKNARNQFADLGFVLGEPDWHAYRVVVWDLESSIDLLYESSRPADPFLMTNYQIIRKALAGGRRG